MRSLFEIYEAMVNESFESKLVRMFANDCLPFASNFSNFCKETHMDSAMWDKIEDDDITMVKKRVTGDENSQNKDIDVVLSMIRAKRADKKVYAGLNHKKHEVPLGYVYIFGYLNDELHLIYTSSWDRVYRCTNKKKLEQEDGKKAIDDLIRGCDTLYVINLAENDNRTIQNQRRWSREGMIPTPDAQDRALKRIQGELGKRAGGVDLTDDWKTLGEFYTYCRNNAKENIKRYREIIANRKFNDSSTEEIDKLMRLYMDRYMKFMQSVMTQAGNDSSKYVSFYDLNKLINGEAKSSKHSDAAWVNGGLLRLYNSYIEETVDMIKAQKRSGYNFGLGVKDYLERRNSTERQLRALFAKLDAKFKEYGV